nr:NTP transferase domain-containing protein [Halovivax gelatinilyticus]
MCGGRGRRLESEVEKPLYPVDGTPMVDRVLAALAESSIEASYAVVSPNAPGTRDYLGDRSVELIETPGNGYVDDLRCALADPRIDRPVLTTASDLPLLTPGVIDEILETYADLIDRGDRTDTEAASGSCSPSMTVCVPVALKDRLGVSTDRSQRGDDSTVPAGLNVVGSGDRSIVHVGSDPAIAVNVNRPTDGRVAERLIDEHD